MSTVELPPRKEENEKEKEEQPRQSIRDVLSVFREEVNAIWTCSVDMTLPRLERLQHFMHLLSRLEEVMCGATYRTWIKTEIREERRYRRPYDRLHTVALCMNVWVFCYTYASMFPTATLPELKGVRRIRDALYNWLYELYTYYNASIYLHLYDEWFYFLSEYHKQEAHRDAAAANTVNK
jgi:hypothetical protein